MRRVENFVYDVSSAESFLVDIESYALRKAFSKAITEKYLATGLYTEMNRQSTETVVKKSKSFKQANFLRDIKPRNAADDGESLGLGFQDNISEMGNKSTTPSKKTQVSGKSTTTGVTEKPQSAEKNPNDNEDEIVAGMIKTELGFSHVIEALSKSKRPIVGHNAIYDLAFVYHQFYKELPATYG